MPLMRILIQRYGAITYILGLQTLLFLFSFFFSFFPKDISLALNPEISTLVSQPWTLFTFAFLPNSHLIGFLFDILWVFYFGFILRDFRKDWFIWLSYLFAIFFYTLFAIGMTFIFPHEPLWDHPIHGAVIGNFTILCLVAVCTPNFRIPLFLLGSVPVKWIVFIYGILAIVLSHGMLLFPYLFAFTSSLVFIKTEFLYSIASFFQNLNTHLFLSNQRKSIQDLEEEVNRILDKIRQKGIKSLTRKEKKLLDEYRQYIDSK